MAKAPFKCPSCGHALGDRHDPHKLIDHLPIGGVRRAVLRILLANFAREVNTSLIVDCVYSGTADGGPMTAMEGISVHAYELRKLLEPFGLTIRGRQGGKHCGGSTFRLDWTDAPALQ
jgi:hypothetical protein